MKASMNDWVEWKRQCAAALCPPDTQAALREFALLRFQTFFRRYATDQAASLPLSGADAWHLFETRLITRNTLAGKRYKDWLFARVDGSSDNPLDVIQGGATLILRDVVREHLCAEYPPHLTQSVYAPLSENDASLTLADVLPGNLDTSGEVARREFSRLAAQHAEVFFEAMSLRERIALLARHLGISLAHPAVVRAAGCGKSMVSSALHAFVRRVADGLTRDYAEDDKESLRILCLLTLESARERVAAWGSSEKSAAALFLLVRDA